MYIECSSIFKDVIAALCESVSHEFYIINTVIIFCKNSNIERKLCITEFLILPAAKMLQAWKCLKMISRFAVMMQIIKTLLFLSISKAVRVVLSQSVKGCVVY